MRFPRGIRIHGACSPQEFARSPNITGLSTLDRAIWANPSKAMARKLSPYTDVVPGEPTPTPERGHGALSDYVTNDIDAHAYANQTDYNNLDDGE